MNPETCKPRNKNVLVKKDAFETKTESGIEIATDPTILSEGNRGARTAVIVAAADDTTEPFEVGQRILYHNKFGTDFSEKEKDYMFLHEDDVLAFVDKPITRPY